MAFDRKTDLANQIEQTGKSYLEDLSHIAEDKLNGSPMGEARSPLMFTAECVGFNNWVAEALGGTFIPMPDNETRARYFSQMDTFEKAKEGIESSCARLRAALEFLDEEELDDPTMTPWGASTTKYKLASMTVIHMVYHNGQVNYIQTCYGDTVNHWH